MIDPQKIFKRFASDCEAERFVAANKLYESFTKDGGHPDDWVLHKKGTKPPRDRAASNRAATAWEAMCKAAEADRDNEKMSRKHAEDTLKQERKKREQDEAELAKLREQLKRAKAKPPADPAECVDLFSALLPQATVDKLSAEQIAARIQALIAERERRQNNLTAQIDLIMRQLTEALYRRHADLYGQRKRGSKAPTVSEFLESHAGKSASWCRQCYKAYTIVTAGDWDGDTTGGVEGIIKAAADPNRPKVKRVSKVQKRLDALVDVVRRREWEHAERMVGDWDTPTARCG